ncbi:LOW QUALITY PROTEIN: Secreted protein [Phytophthora palmivora]|uniref:Secreted protein n=1 Tax=Phytophthora palmivora TaxID=4796 RepID=A0A2P4XLH7_9STRA|nr:LOW QUALITY PROTEIN: Secreted protein [Phytophthora palmivora]
MDRTKKTHIIMKKMEEEEKTRSRAMENVGDWDSGTEEQTHATAVPEAHEEDDKHKEKGGADEEDKSADSDVEQDKSGRESATQTSGSEKRKRSSLRVEGDLHYVPVIKKQHASWEDFDEYLKKYGKKYSTKMVIKETLSTELRNKRIMKQKEFVGMSLSKIPIAPNELGPFQRVYICTHGWKMRSRSSGKRPLQNTLWTGCGARFLAQLTESDGKRILNETFTATITRFPKKYTCPIQVPHGSPVLNDVEMMVNAGGKATRIYDYIRSNTPHRVTMGDVGMQLKPYPLLKYHTVQANNVLCFVKGDALSDEDQVAELLVKFNLESPGNVSTVHENARGQTAVVSVSSELMRKHYSRFPELLLIDCTHNTNRNRYQLLTLMGMDQYGNGQPVQHSIIERNADWHMVKAIEHFQAVNEWDRTQVVMMDKDLNEVEWLKKAIKDDKKYGTYESDVLKQMEFCISNMVYSRTELEFMDHVGEFKTLSARNEREDLWRYFEANWIGCREMWVSAFRLALPHFRNNTNNRLENFFGKLKVDLEKDTYKIKTLLPGSTRNANYGEEMNTLLEMTTSWVAEVFFEEYQFATNPDSMQHYNFIDTGFGVNIVRDVCRYHVDKTTWLCNCEFSLTLKMPCRHVILYRKHIGNVLTIPYASIPSRFCQCFTHAWVEQDFAMFCYVFAMFTHILILGGCAQCSQTWTFRQLICH